jgi:DNA-binding IclR family transcriptional regulator
MFPIIHTMKERDFLIFNGVTLTYSIGYKVFQAGNSFINNFDVMEQIQDEMQNIVNVCSETCHFATLIGGDVLYLKKIDSPEPIRMISTVGSRLPAYGTGLGKALLIDYDISGLRRLYPNGLKPLTDKTITDFQALESQLEQARAEGVTYEAEESNQFIRCIAIPIRKDNKVTAALSVAVPTFRYSDEKRDLIRHLLFNSKTKIENWLKISPIDLIDKNKTSY